MDYAITTSGLTKHYGHVTAVEQLSLRVEAGEIYAFLGLNGAGKTTTIRMLLGMVRPTAGKAEILGTVISPRVRDIWSNVGYLVETPSAYPDLTVRENLEVTRRIRLLPDAQAVDRIMEQLFLTPYADRRARALSLGNAQRLGLAKAMIHHPKLLILDEPANGLDPAGIVEIREMIRTLAREEGVTVFISSHNLSEVARLATRIGIINKGRLIDEFEANELDQRCRRWLEVAARDNRAAAESLVSAGYSVTVGLDSIIELTDKRAVDNPDIIARLLVAAGTPPTRLLVEQEDLESYFLRLVGAAGESA